MAQPISSTARPFNYEVPGWPPGTRHYFTSDGRILAVCVDLGIVDGIATAALEETLAAVDGPTLASGENTIVLQPTVVIECRPDGHVDGDAMPEPIHQSEPATSHADALAAAGYELIPINH